MAYRGAACLLCRTLFNTTTLFNGQLHVPCPLHAQAVGQDGNFFRPLCQCMSGFKSSSSSGEKILLREVDVCVSCSDSADCGTAPTESPTHRPTATSMPSASPSLSSVPTNVPTVSGAPSFQPVTKTPTSKPTVTMAPSLQPSSRPSSYLSVFDGDYCRFDIECGSGRCESNLCISNVSPNCESLFIVEYIPFRSSNCRMCCDATFERRYHCQCKRTRVE